MVTRSRNWQGGDAREKKPILVFLPMNFNYLSLFPVTFYFICLFFFFSPGNSRYFSKLWICHFWLLIIIISKKQIQHLPEGGKTHKKKWHWNKRLVRILKFINKYVRTICCKIETSNPQPPVVFEQTPSDPEQLRHNLMNTAGFHSPFKNACTTVTPARSTCWHQ